MRFTLVKKFLRQLEFVDPKAPQITNPNSGDVVLNVYMDVDTAPLEDSMYNVDLKMLVECKTSKLLTVFSVKLVYSAIVSVDKDVAGDDVNEILKVSVPQLLYDDVRFVVGNVTRDSEYPIVMLKDHTFVMDREKEKETVDESDNDVCYKCDYNELAQKTKMKGAYSYYYDFIVPIKYNHPDYEDFDEEFWDVFFKLLVGDFATLCSLENTDGSIPNLVFSFDKYENTSVADLSYEDICSIASLLMDRPDNMLSNIDVIAWLNADSEFYDKLSHEELVSREDFYQLYGSNANEIPDEDDSDSDEKVSAGLYSILDTMYSRLLDCDILTMEYRE
ncbi:MAG: protein-export chaperone SecB [Bacteroidales bacterium]|nr:protein-export chaperone SecB [Bacteroidales bacterium]